MHGLERDCNAHPAAAIVVRDAEPAAASCVALGLSDQSVAHPDVAYQTAQANVDRIH